MSTATTASISTHILDTSRGRPARGVPVQLSARADREGRWTVLGSSVTDDDGRCTDLPTPPEGSVHLQLLFDVESYFREGGRRTRPAEQRTEPSADEIDEPSPSGGEPFFPEVTVVFAIVPGEHYHVPLLLNPFGYSVYRGS